MFGLGLRLDHIEQVLLEKPKVDWFEILSENYLHRDSLALKSIVKIRESYPMGLHGVGLSLGSADGIVKEHLHRLQKLIHLTDPFIISEHLSWSKIGGVYLPDLLPVPYTQDSIDIFVENIDVAQSYLKRELLIENPSTYIEYKSSALAEVEFLVNICKRSGAKILLDVNNIYVSACNHNWDCEAYIDAIPSDMVGQIHIAGHTEKRISDDKIIRIDSHDNYVCDEVWALYRRAITRFGQVPTLLEWDDNIPPLDVLITEVGKAANAFA